VTEAEVPVPAALPPPAPGPKKCAFCEDVAAAPLHGPRYVDEKERWFCDLDCMDLFSRLANAPEVSRRQPATWAPMARRYEGLNAAQRDKLEEIDAEDGGPADPKPKRPPKIGDYP